MRWKILVVAFMVAGSLAACGEKMTPEQRAAQDEKAIAMVEETNASVHVPIVPQPILFPDIEANNLYGTSCAFVADGGGLGAVMIAMFEDGYMKLDDKIIRFAADAGSAELPFGARSKYDGKDYAIALKIEPGEGTPAGAESVNYKGHLTVQDSQGRSVYDKTGEVQCGS